MHGIDILAPLCIIDKKKRTKKQRKKKLSKEEVAWLPLVNGC